MGVIIPTVNTVTEPEFNAMRPEGVTVHVTRMPIHFHPEEDGFKSLMEDLEIRLNEFALFAADIVAYNCTVGSMACPPEMLLNKLEAVSGSPSVSPADSVIQALNTLEADRISLATPYLDIINEHEKEFLERSGIEVLKMAGMTFDAVEPELGRKFAEVPQEEIYRHALSVDHPDAKALFLSCANFPTAALVQQIEIILGKPVITSNTATFWAGLRKAGITAIIQPGGSVGDDQVIEMANKYDMAMVFTGVRHFKH